MESIGSRKYHTHSLDTQWKFQARGRGVGGRGSLRPTFFMYIFYEPKMNIARGEFVGSNQYTVPGEYGYSGTRHCK